MGITPGAPIRGSNAAAREKSDAGEPNDGPARPGDESGGEKAVDVDASVDVEDEGAWVGVP